MVLAAQVYGQQDLITPLVESELSTTVQTKLSTLRENGGDFYAAVLPVQLHDLEKVMEENEGLLRMTLSDTTYFAYPTSIEKQVNGDYVWTGNFLEQEGDCFFFREGDKIYGHVRVGSGEYDIQNFEPDVNILISYNHAAMEGTFCGNVAPGNGGGGGGGLERPELPEDWETFFSHLTEETEEFCQDDAVKVLFLFTPAANLVITDRQQPARIAIKDMNVALGNSEAFGVKVELVGSEIPMGYVETPNSTGNPNFSPIGDEIDNPLNPNYLPNNPLIQSMRDLYEADIVVLVGDYDDARVRGATEVGPIESRAYAIVNLRYVNTYITSHEVGHLFGCRHEKRGASACPDPNGPIEHASEFSTSLWPFGLRKTIMHTRCSSREWRRISYFSNPNVKYKGAKTGKEDENNVLKLQQTVSIVRNFRPNTLGVGVLITNKPSCIDPLEEFTLNALTCGNPDLDVVSYQWSVSTDGIAYIFPQGNTSSIFSYTMPTTFNLYVRLVVTFSNGQTATAFTTIPRCRFYFDDFTIDDFFGGGVADLDDEVDNGETPTVSHVRVSTYPNPTVQEITLDYTLAKAEKVKVTLHGLDYHNLSETITLGEFEKAKGTYKEKLQVNNVPSGTYLLTVKAAQILYQNRIIIK
ncbi:MAG: T9SS type A sorting domain-containing protein [Bacteroidota bacterium]